MLRIVIVLFLTIIVNSPSMVSLHVIFPSPYFTIDCRIDNTNQLGICKPFDSCAIVQNNWFHQGIYPTTCSFDRFTQIVCCPLDNHNIQTPIMNEPSTTTTVPIDRENIKTQQRISERICEDYYTLPKPSDENEFHITVVGGELADKGEFPFMAAIGWNNIFNEIEFNCGGFLVSSNFILTAAHCTTLGGAKPDMIRIGDDALNATNNDSGLGLAITNPSEDIKIESIFVHPNYNPKETYNDIALIKLSSNSTIKPACLWQSHNIIGKYYQAKAIGYGHTQFAGTRSNYLMKVDLNLIGNLECNKSYPPEEQFSNGIISSQMCAGDPTGAKDTCQGDSGGPILVKDINKTPFVIGITSFGSLCASGIPSVYTRISSYLDWIESIVWS